MTVMTTKSLLVEVAEPLALRLGTSRAKAMLERDKAVRAAVAEYREARAIESAGAKRKDAAKADIEREIGKALEWEWDVVSDKGLILIKRNIVTKGDIDLERMATDHQQTVADYLRCKDAFDTACKPYAIRAFSHYAIEVL